MAIQTKSFKIPWHFILIFFLLVIGIGIAGYLYYDVQKQHIKKEKKNELQAICQLKVNQIANWRQERLRDAEAISKNHLLIQYLLRWLKTGEKSEIREEILNWMESFLRLYDYSGIFLLDAKGKVRLTVANWEEPFGSYLQTPVEGVIHGGKVVFVDLYREEKNNHIHIDILIPLIPKGTDTLPNGVLLLRIEPDKFFYPFIQSWPTPSRSAESLLVRREGNEIVFLNELRHRKNTALTLRFPISEKQLPAAMAARGQEGIVEGLDYRGVKVLASIWSIPDTNWFLIAKVDLEEIYAPIRERARFVIILVGILIVSAGVIIGFFWGQEASQFYQKQYKAELERQALIHHYDYLTKYANDIILLTDQNLKIIETNDRAAASYGYTRDELLQLNARQLRSPETPLLDEFVKQVEDKKGMVFETVHQRKDGTTFPVETSIRVIEVEGKKFYQSIIRDNTERKQAEKEREKLIHELQETLTKVKTLSGLLPICASCKKIRDDKGYWNQIESYIQDHSGAEFSHGICPECMKKLYPEFYKDEK